ncbi:hypothetical protein KC19_9G113300 [Ceratodon purpureus]|uniref:DUF7950 domain-containing protein n=1 Tax=Ceratodon purpureus TaxID=3225 RepID=A0A8T0GU10_CERPU|nr:hypothetical protein KC19_9G113300 [Ceratodon purpureus]
MRETPAGVYMSGSMMPTDQGGCMLVMHSGIPMYSTSGSKTDHIMSRYRPIAPKPVAKAENDQADTHSISSLSADNSTTRSSTEYRSGGNRSRKRPPDSSVPGKKGRGGAKSVGPKNLASEVNFKLTPIFSDRVAPGFGPGGLQRFKDSCEQSLQSGVSVSLSLSAKSPESYHDHAAFNNVHSTLRCGQEGSLRLNMGDVERDRGFMERAAASTPSLFPAEHGNAGLKKVSFLGYSTSFGAESEVCSGGLGNIPSLFTAEQTSMKRESFVGCPSGSTSFGTESEVCSVEEAADSKKENIVTLSLLPDTPSFVNTRQSSSTTAIPLLRSDIRWGSEKQAVPSSDLNTSLTMSSRGWGSDEEGNVGGHSGLESYAGRPYLERATETSQGDAGEQVVDANYLEQRHGGSSEAVMLTDELDRVLWVNSAFKRLNNERMSSRMQAIGPHIDPLGIRTHLATIAFQPPFPAFKCKALLWGFLKKFIMQEGGAHKSSNLPEVQAKVLSPPAKVIAPQPVRAIGSTIKVQSIVTVDPHAAPLTDGFESVQESLDKGDMPSVITDLKFRVRWVNTAYKRLVGQPKCSWLASTVGGSAEEDTKASLRIAGDVSLVCDASQLPVDIAAFSCRVGIQWNHQGDLSAMSVPSEVVRLDDGAAGSLYVWGFDV